MSLQRKGKKLLKFVTVCGQAVCYGKKKEFSTSFEQLLFAVQHIVLKEPFALVCIFDCVTLWHQEMSL